MPLVFVGSYFGNKKTTIEDLVKTNKIPRWIPEQAWYMRLIFSILIGGMLPFRAIFIEFFFILTSIWMSQFYIFGFISIVFVILIFTCAEITIILCYFQLCSEYYNWWWRSYLIAASSTCCLFVYVAFYLFTKLEMIKFFLEFGTLST